MIFFFFADWNIKGLGMNSSSNYKSSSDLSMLMGSSCSSQNLENQQQPKLENFLGRHSFGHHESAAYNNTSSDYMFNSNIGGGGGGGIHNNSSIGLSMIKTWLRNQPAPPPQPENKNDGGASGGNLTSSAQTLSLSMSTGSQSSSTLPLLTVSSAGGGSGGESSSSDNKQPKTTTAVDSQTGAIEAVPRKSIDTFGQRTSIYRGVTRCVILCMHFQNIFFDVFNFLSFFLSLLYKIHFSCLIYKGFDFPGTDGPADTRLIYGIIVVEERDKLAREGKVYIYLFNYIYV